MSCDIHEDLEQEKSLKELPNPLGFNILVEMIPELKVGSIILTQDVLDRSAAGNVRVKVLKVGPYAFKSERFLYLRGGDGTSWVKPGKIYEIKRWAGTPVVGSKGRYQYVDDEQFLGEVNE